MIHIGTSGWNYNHWKGVFYPKKLPIKDWLSFYAEHFQTVEINNSFYKLPLKATMEKWHGLVPENFIFAAKASRFITHMKKLKSPEETIGNFMERVEPLGGKLGPILFQLSPRLHFDPERLISFLKLLPKGHQFAFEYRDPTWWNDDAYKALEKYHATFCIYDMGCKSSPIVVTSKMIYIRFHGPNWFGPYSDRGLRNWAAKIADWNRDGRDIYCYFNNDAFGHAVRDAMTLRRLLGGK